MELESILSVVEPSNRNAIWLHPVKGKIIQKIYGPKGWEVINNGGSGEASIPEARVDTLGGVKLGTSISSEFLPVGNIPSDYGSGLGFLIDSAIFKIEKNSAISLRVNEIGGLTYTGKGIRINLGTSYNSYPTVSAIPLCIGSCINDEDFSAFISDELIPSQSNVPFVPVNPDQFKLGRYGLELISQSSSTKVTWDANSNMNDFKTAGVYDIYGERTRQDDNLPILNASSGHSIAARLTVVASTLQPANNEICVTQFLQLSNRVGGEGATYVRTYNENNNGLNGWSAWQKQMDMKEYGIVTDTEAWYPTERPNEVPSGPGMYYFIDNGMYSGIYVDEEYISGQAPSFLETFVLVVINDYAVSGQAGLPRHITQLKYAVDAITGQSTVKKRVGTGNDSISWSDWEDIGGGGLQEVDITDAVKAYGLPTLVAQGLMKKNTKYRVELSSSSNCPILDWEDKIRPFIESKWNKGVSGNLLFIIERIDSANDIDTKIVIDCYSNSSSNTEGRFYYKFYLTPNWVLKSADMTEL